MWVSTADILRQSGLPEIDKSMAEFEKGHAKLIEKEILNL